MPRVTMKNLTNRQLMMMAIMLLMVIICAVMPTHGSLGIMATFTPGGAMALYSGAYFQGYKKLLFPLLILWISDIVLNRFLYFDEWVLFYEGGIWTYGAFALMTIVGKILLKKVNVVNFIGSALLVTFIHWIVTHLGVFLGGSMYPMSWAGWWASLMAAIPFEQNLLIGTLIYGTVIFGTFEWVPFKIPMFTQQVKLIK